MASSRVKIPKKTADQILFDADLLCCVCRERGQHIHHLDGDPKNNAIDNLVLLCVPCHDDVTSTARLVRKLNEGVVRMYRHDLHRWVRHRRSLAENRSFAVSENDHDERLFPLILDAVSVRDVQKIAYRLGGLEWDDLLPILYELNSFPEDMGMHTRKAILEVLENQASHTRMRMPTDVGLAISSMTYQTLPLWSLRQETEGPITDTMIETLHLGVAVGEALAYDGGLYLKDFLVVDAGLVLLWRTLAYAKLNHLAGTQERALQGFKLAEDGARRGGDPDAPELVQLYLENGNNVNPRYPDYPDNLGNRLVSENRVSRGRTA